LEIKKIDERVEYEKFIRSEGNRINKEIAEQVKSKTINAGIILFNLLS
jgi:hypothetical protein|tara:strand:+ start:269 stop:412 length:144 start_codon:yes stop_codon:yes gene_type:complete